MSAVSIAADFIKAHEGCRLVAYQDSVGVWTIGYGHTGHDVEKGVIWTTAQADQALSDDLILSLTSVRSMVMVPLSDQQLAALTSFVFNLGAGSLRTSTLLIKVNNKQWLDAAKEMIKWDHAGGTELRGLLIRRLEEAALFLKGS